MGYTEVKIVQDNNGHNYVIPVIRWEEFHKMLEEDNDETFNQEFKKYSIGGCPSQVQIFIQNKDELLNPGKEENRRSGNTTRAADAAIQTLFKDGFVQVRDPYPHKEADRFLMDLILRRMNSEHSSVFDILEVDRARCTIKFKKEYPIKIS